MILYSTHYSEQQSTICSDNNYQDRLNENGDFQKMAQLEESFESSSEDSYADVPEPPHSQTLLKTESLQRSLKRKTRSG